MSDPSAAARSASPPSTGIDAGAARRLPARAGSGKVPQPSTDDPLDREMMRRCIAAAVRSGSEGEYPYGVVIRRGDDVVVEAINAVARECDVTRHAEVVAISVAQKALDTVSLSDCTIYVSAEPCVYCSYAIRESRIRRVVYGLSSPHIGGVSKWNVLTDPGLSAAMPEVFDPPPEIVSGFMAREVDEALLTWNPLVWGVMRERELFVDPGTQATRDTGDARDGIAYRILTFLRFAIFDRFGRR